METKTSKIEYGGRGHLIWGMVWGLQYLNQWFKIQSCNHLVMSWNTIIQTMSLEGKTMSSEGKKKKGGIKRSQEIKGGNYQRIKLSGISGSVTLHKHHFVVLLSSHHIHNTHHKTTRPRARDTHHLCHIVIIFIIFLWYKTIFCTDPHCVSLYINNKKQKNPKGFPV